MAPKRFLWAREHAEAVIGIALEAQDHIDHVLEKLGTGERPLLRDMTDEDHRHAALPWQASLAAHRSRGLA